MTSEAPSFYLLVNDQTTGPVSKEHISEQLAAGAITPETLFATSGADAWRSVRLIVDKPEPVGMMIARRLSLAIGLTLLGLFLNVFLSICCWVTALVVFIFTPYAVARRRKHPNTLGIALLTFLLGWTFVGWVVALIWAVHVRKAHES